MAAVMQQMSFIRKAPIYHISLTCVKEECPTCHAENKASKTCYDSYTDSYYAQQYDACPVCEQLFDWDKDAVEAAAKYSKEYLQAMRDCPEGGAVRKKENGHYETVL